MRFLRRVHWFAIISAVVFATLAPAAWAQQRPYIGYVYPAGGQEGTSFQIRLGGQGVDEVKEILVSGKGVSGKLQECHRFLNNQEVQLLNDQLKQLKQVNPDSSSMIGQLSSRNPLQQARRKTTASGPGKDEARTSMIAVLEQRIAEHVPRPACRAIATLVFADIAVAPDAPPGEREIRLVTTRGVSNPLAFHVGQLPEFSRKPMNTAPLQVLGKEEQALRKRPAQEVEDRITLPCTLNGQIASGEVNRYRFSAHKGQRLVISTLARQLIPYIADAVPGWFQAVLELYDSNGKEVAYDDHYEFKPDPVAFYQVPEDGDYVLAIHDALYRGREDFTYRISLGELPFVKSIFPLGARVGEPVTIKMKGWHLDKAELTPPDKDAGPGIYYLAADRKGLVSNRVPFSQDTLPECHEKEHNDDLAHAQKVTLPIIINGRIDRPNDWDVFQFSAKMNDTVVAEVYARRLDSPLDSVLKLTDCKGTVLAFNDDHEDLASGLNTHHADSYFMAKLPADGTYYIHIGDTASNGGEEYAYRLRISAPQPDFVLRAVPASASLRSKGSTTVSVLVMRKDGFSDPISLGLKDVPAGFSSAPVKLSGTQDKTNLSIKTNLIATKDPVDLKIEGRVKVGDKEIVNEALPAEDRMQAFLWRHLVPAKDMKALVFDPAEQLPPRHEIMPALAPDRHAAAALETTSQKALPETNPVSGTTSPLAPPAGKPKFTKQQVANRLKELKRLCEEGLITDDFYWQRVAECEAAQ